VKRFELSADTRISAYCKREAREGGQGCGADFALR
jgi:hypothetical protein